MRRLWAQAGYSQAGFASAARPHGRYLLPSSDQHRPHAL